ncbi:hypothetical protein LTR84_008887 [Exophiala bonariae]|uniref:Azaphilone pigments biosynthesis cluster protein L N-terminal domain-containing protein n=1 Tax=Exophiala bonariae TaxID=1690606 RepID=A0AAV9MWA4_9EURO|nr:hypothetical protein LTR84_008887 [Exophiala bonariae]
MADPLSIAASAVALTKLSQTCVTRLLHLIKRMQTAPADIKALSNEVADLNVFFDAVQVLSQNVDADSGQQFRFLATVPLLLERARAALSELEGLLEEFTSYPNGARARLQWIRRGDTLLSLRKRFKQIKTELNGVLTLSTAAATYVHGSRLSFLPLLPLSVSWPTLRNSARIPKIEILLEDLHNALNLDDRAAGTSQSVERFSPETTIFIPVSRSRHCKVVCNCLCHSAGTHRTPPFLKRFIGTLFLGYTGSPLFSAQCNVKTCQNPLQGSLDIIYCFPLWYCQRALNISVSSSVSLGTTIRFHVKRRIPWGGGQDTLLRFALTGNIDGAKLLIASRNALLTDVDPNHGRTALHYAVLRNKVEVCELLLLEGADPQLQDDSGISASQKAWEQILCQRGSTAEIEGLKRLFPGSEELENYGFSYIHNVVLDILPAKLEAELQNVLYRNQVHAVDRLKRTALHWAATRGDEQAVRHLVEAGSDVNARDEFNSTALTLAASTGSVRILELLLLHGADVHARTSIGSQAMHHACRHQSLVAPVEILLQAGASLDSTNKNGHSPLCGAAISNRHDIGAFLLARGVDMHVRSLHGDTPLFETIFHNSHEFLQLLLAQGADHGAVNNAGSTVLHAAALEADTRTVEILRAAGIQWTLQSSRRDRSGATALEIARRRVKPPLGFLDAFEQILDPV